jgi:3-(3-hydroxy-phenyl)propionate hydroxylase
MTLPQDAECDVAIVGCGPTGATLAALLGRMGLRVVALERADGIHARPRAVGFDHDAMRVFQRAGVAEALAPHVAPFRDAVYVGVGGAVIQRVAHMPPPYPLTWAPNYTCDQPGVEAVLRAALGAMPGVTLATGCEVTRFADEGDVVRVETRDAAGRAATLRAGWLVGCDGAASMVRRTLDIALESLDYDEPWIVVDVHVDPAVLPRLPRTNVQYCEPERPCTHVVCPGTHRRWEFMLLDGEPREGEVAPERLWALLARWLAPGEAEIRRAAAYRFHALVAAEWRRGRVLLAGDAAHQTPPFLGQGMCQGVRDAANVAWKLARVVRGDADGGLLDTYAAERRPHVIATTLLAKALGQLISERDPQRARARDARLLAAGGGAARTIIRQDMIPGLDAGLLAPGAPLAGQAFPQPTVATARGERLLDDLAPDAFRLVVDAAAAGDALPELERLATARRVALIALGAEPLAERVPLVRPLLAAHGCIGALVRPDHYVVGGFADPAGAAALLGAAARHGAALLHPPDHRGAEPRRTALAR